MGRMPNTVENEVIRMGRRRMPAACTTASVISRPLARSWLANSTIRIAFLVTRPISMISPMRREDVQGLVEQPQRDQRPEHRQRHREQDGQRVDEALELGRQHQEDEQDRQHEHEVEGALAVAELARLAAQVALDRRRQLVLPDAVQVVQGLAQAHARRQVGGDRGRAHAVEVVQLLGRDRLLDLHHVRQLHQSAADCAARSGRSRRGWRGRRPASAR